MTTPTPDPRAALTLNSAEVNALRVCADKVGVNTDEGRFLRGLADDAARAALATPPAPEAAVERCQANGCFDEATMDLTVMVGDQQVERHYWWVIDGVADALPKVESGAREAFRSMQPADVHLALLGVDHDGAAPAKENPVTTCADPRCPIPVKHDTFEGHTPEDTQRRLGLPGIQRCAYAIDTSPLGGDIVCGEKPDSLRHMHHNQNDEGTHWCYDDGCHPFQPAPTPPAPEAAVERCAACGDTRWVEDQNWSPDYPGTKRTPHDGLIPCGICNHGGWDAPWPAPTPPAPTEAAEATFRRALEADLRRTEYENVEPFLRVLDLYRDAIIIAARAPLTVERLAMALHKALGHGYHGGGWDHGDGDIAAAILAALGSGQ